MFKFLRRIVIKLSPKLTKKIIQVYYFFVFLRYRNSFEAFVEFRGIRLKVGKDVSIFPSLQKGNYEKFELDLILGYSYKNDLIFWDVGANIGIYSVLFSKMHPDWKIFAFEPNKEVEPILKENIVENHAQNIEVLTLALSNKSSTSLLKLNKFRAGGNTLIDTQGNRFRVLEVITAMGDELIALKKIPKPDFIKIDCEGHELKVLIGLRDTIFNSKPIMSIELLKDNWDYSEFAVFINHLNLLISRYGSAILIKHGKSYNINFIDLEVLDNSLQTLILGLK